MEPGGTEDWSEADGNGWPVPRGGEAAGGDQSTSGLEPGGTEDWRDKDEQNRPDEEEEVLQYGMARADILQ